MLEKIGLPAKPSLRGKNWVVDASHCQGCASPFSFINRKHHCRRCGGIFCNSCTNQRMVLRGQGDSPVRICDPCKKLEEAARFEVRHGHRSGNKVGGRGSSTLSSKNGDELLSEILGNNKKGSSSSRSYSATDHVPRIQRESDGASCSNMQEVDVNKILSVGESFGSSSELGSASPEELRQQAVEEKKKYRTLRAEGKSAEALKAFKRGKELERQADALELSIRKNRRKVLRPRNSTENESISGSDGSGRKGKLFGQADKDKDDLFSELKELGWSAMDAHGEDKKPANMSLDGELSSLLGEVSQRTSAGTGTSRIDKTEVGALKKKALALKREGKLAEAKEELKKAKVLEKQLEEQEFLGEAEDSDDEISALIRGMNIKEDEDVFAGYQQQQSIDVEQLMTADDLGGDDGIEVTDDDLFDPEMVGMLKSLGWSDDLNVKETNESQSLPFNKEGLQSEILSLKKEALLQKRAGNVAEARAQLKKAKLLEKELEDLPDEDGNLFANFPSTYEQQQSIDVEQLMTADDLGGDDGIEVTDEDLVNPEMSGMLKSLGWSDDLDTKKTSEPPSVSFNKEALQSEILSLKKEAVLQKRAGNVTEAKAQLKKAKLLEKVLEDLESETGNVVANIPSTHDKVPVNQLLTADDLDGNDGLEVTDEDMFNTEMAGMLKSLGWSDDHEIKETSETQSVSINKEALRSDIRSLKKEALLQKRAGNVTEAKALLKKAKLLERELEDLEGEAGNLLANIPSTHDKVHRAEPKVAPKSRLAIQRELLSLKKKALDLTREGKIEEAEEELKKGRVLEQQLEEIDKTKDLEGEAGNLVADIPSMVDQVPANKADLKVAPKSRLAIQRELLALKKKALALRREGKIDEAEEELKKGRVLEQQLEGIDKKKNLDGEAENLVADIPSTNDKVPANRVELKVAPKSRLAIQRELLALKKKVLALKREGKIDEAEEELKKGRVLEQQLEEFDNR